MAHTFKIKLRVRFLQHPPNILILYIAANLKFLKSLESGSFLKL